MYNYRTLLTADDPRRSYRTATANTSSKKSQIHQNCVLRLRQRPCRIAEAAKREENMLPLQQVAPRVVSPICSVS